MDRRSFLKLCVSILAAPSGAESVKRLPANRVFTPEQIGMFYDLIQGTIYCCGAKKIADGNLLQREEMEDAESMSRGFQSILGALRHNREKPVYTEMVAEVFQAMQDRKNGIATAYDTLFTALPKDALEGFDKGVSKDEVSWFKDALAEHAIKNNLQTKLKTGSYRVLIESGKHWRKVDGKETYFTDDLASARKFIWPGARNRLETAMIIAGSDYLYPDSKASGERQR